MLSMIPLPYKIIALVGLLLGAAYFGYVKGTEKSAIALANYKAQAEQQIADLKEVNMQINDDVTIQYVDRTNTIRDKHTVYRDVVTNNVVPQHDLSTGWIHVHDAAARLINPNISLASNMSPSGVMDQAALTVVLSNYSICQQNAEQLRALQLWVRESEAAVAASNKENAK